MSAFTELIKSLFFNQLNKFLNYEGNISNR